MNNFIVDSYKKKKEAIKSRLSAFKSLEKEKYFNEFLFCLLTPQSNAQKAWGAVNEISKLRHPKTEQIAQILKSRTRFHNNKAKYVTEAHSKWQEIAPKLVNPNIPELRNWLAENVKGYGYILKE
jgi:N-glycosylase/DNA lyase